MTRALKILDEDTTMHAIAHQSDTLKVSMHPTARRKPKVGVMPVNYATITRAAVQLAYVAIGAILLVDPGSVTEVAHYSILLLALPPEAWGSLFIAVAIYVLLEMLRGSMFPLSALAVASVMSGVWGIGIASAAIDGHVVVWSTPIGWGLISILLVGAAYAPIPRSDDLEK